ncbi:MAG TPA: hypothetical protein G4O15_01530 [Dehalococcoidia bacterium]|nr:hypothetical protein [Dehalococcoidia bacterium]
MYGEELYKRLAKEYRYAATKMQESPTASKKLYYFSIFYGEPQRIINLEWDRDLTLLFVVCQYVFNTLTALSNPPALNTHPINHDLVFTALTDLANELALHFEKKESNPIELYVIMGRLAEIGYAATGNGSYLYEKGDIKF